MRRELYASAGVHALILLWIAFGNGLFRDSPDVAFEVTGVTLLSTAEFEALTAVPAPASPQVEAPVAPLAAPEAETEAPSAPETEARAPDVTQPEAAAPPQPEAAPAVAEPTPPPDAEVADQVAALPAPQDPTAAPDEIPTPREAPRVAPVPAPAPAPDVETAPDVVDRPTTPDQSEAPAPEVTETAPDEATTEIVTEAEEPASSNAPLASMRPSARPSRPAPVETAAAETPPPPEDHPEEPEPESADAMADAIAAAVAAASQTAPAAAETPAPASLSGRPLTSAQRDGFRLAVGGCWNVGSLSSEALQTTIMVGFAMNRDGTPVVDSIRLLDVVSGSDTGARQAFDAARRAIIRCGRSGYDLPDDSYDYWREVEAVFNPEGMRLR